eukprot:CAMPEP_0119489082 /NCGR_PEP_ID=MMETSP1344-20130328/14634_1 /TAXON_ID=236787 /ORGANISM="Florenciella parvula, Strain CCMP2471" /LENGTH=720 /DNA_ID=CAMNT_0007524087 /DNA_START=136 /DNA_END=2298 /DNA_ORIENTATION=+
MSGYGSLPVSDAAPSAFLDPTVEEPLEQKPNTRKVYLAALVATSAGLAIAGVHSQGAARSTSDQWPATVSSMNNVRGAPVTLDSVDSDDLAIGVYNTYTETYGAVGTDYPWNDGSIVEPYREHYFELTGDLVDECNTMVTTWKNSDYYGQACTAKWSLFSEDWGTELEQFVGLPATAQTTFESATTYRVKVGLYISSDAGSVDGATLLGDEVKTSLYSRYVRREVRKYTDDDRDSLIATMRLLYDLDDSTGQAKYGKHYRSMQYFVSKHTDLAGDETCDHLHEGLGFLTNHVAISMEFENALRVVDNTLSLPYWDYTIDGNNAQQAAENNGADEEKAWRSSVVFTDEWFGTSSPGNDLNTATMLTGPWANTPVMTLTDYDDDSTSHVSNSYGYLRAPWNTNNNPYVARFNKTFEYETDVMPSCTDYYDMLGYDTWLDFGMNIANGAHGPVHGMLGGAWKANFSGWQAAEEAMGSDSAKNLVYLSVASYPQFWRDGIISCPDSCSEDTALEDCQCTCAGLTDDDTMTTNGDSSGSEATTSPSTTELLQRSGVFERIARHDVKGELLERRQNELTGEVSFSWIGVEELEQESMNTWFFKMVCDVAQTGDMLGSSSPVDPIFWSVHPTVDRLWQWKRLSTDCMYNYSWPSGTSIYGTCSGHDEKDMLPYAGLNPSASNSLLDNKGLYDLLDPTTSDSPYVYDNFEWAHCLQEGSDVRNFCTGS